MGLKTREELLADSALARGLSARFASAEPIQQFERWPEGWVPVMGECHANADRWVESRPGWSVRRGWVQGWVGSDDKIRFFAHSVCVDGNGLLWDVTLIDGVRRGFVLHPGPLGEFLANVASRRWAEVVEL